MENNYSKHNSFFIVPLWALVALILTFFLINNAIKITPVKYKAYVDTTNLNSLRIDFIKTNDLYKLDTTSLNSDTISLKSIIEDSNIFENAIFNHNPIFLVWLSLIVTMVAIASGTCPIYIAEIRNLIDEYTIDKKSILFSIIAAIVTVLVLVVIPTFINGLYDAINFIEDFEILFKKGYDQVPAIISVITLILIVPVLITIFIISIVLTKPLKPLILTNYGEIKYENFANEEIKKYIKINKLLINSLQVLALIIVFAVVTTSILGQSIKNSIIIDRKYFDVFPKEFSYMYGLLFSLFLTIIFVPVYVQSLYRAQLIIEKYERIGEKTTLVDKIKKESSILDNIKLISTVISPLISSVFAKVVESI